MSVHAASIAAAPSARPETPRTAVDSASLIASLLTSEAGSAAASAVASVVLPEPGRPLTRTRRSTTRRMLAYGGYVANDLRRTPLGRHRPVGLICVGFDVPTRRGLHSSAPFRRHDRQRRAMFTRVKQC